MSKRGRRQPFDTERHFKIKNDATGKMVKVSQGGPPKKLTKGLRRQLARLKVQNPAEYDRQMTMIREAQ